MEDLFSLKRASFYLRATFDLPTTPASLATMATRGGGPRFFRIGKYARYRRRDLDEWALKRFSVLMDSTSTRDGARLDDFFDFGEEADDIETDIFNTCHPESDFHLRKDFEFERELQLMIDNKSEERRDGKSVFSKFKSQWVSEN